MNIKLIKELTNSILENQEPESSYIEYKASEKQIDKIIKTICAYGNNYYQNKIQYIFVGVNEENNKESKAIPVLPIVGIEKNRLEIVYNKLNSYRTFLHPNVKFEIVENNFKGKYYFIIVVPMQKGGPFETNEKAYKDKDIKLKCGRYIRNDFETKIANVGEEYELIRKFADYSFDEDINGKATIDDLSIDYIKEYLKATSNRLINEELTKEELAKTLNLVSEYDSTGKRVYNFAVLMFSEKPSNFIKNSYVEMIIDINGTKQLMESKIFEGPIWKQYYAVIKYIKDNFINSLTIRESDKSLSRKVDNYPYTAIEELVANALIHNNYQNYKNIQIYINEKEINIVNYNKPMPPIDIKALNEQRTFSERNAINPSLRKCFKDLHIIESYGTGIGEAKRSLEENGSPSLFFKYFDDADITSVVIPINEEYYKIKFGLKKENDNDVQNKGSDNIQNLVLNSNYSSIIKNNILRLYQKVNEKNFSNRTIKDEFNVSDTTATKYIKIMIEMNVIETVSGVGKGKYKFKQSALY